MPLFSDEEPFHFPCRDQGKEQYRRVWRQTRHPNFTDFPVLVNDIAVLRLWRPLDLGPDSAAKPVHLAEETAAGGSHLVVSGWGDTGVSKRPFRSNFSLMVLFLYHSERWSLFLFEDTVPELMSNRESSCNIP